MLWSQLFVFMGGVAMVTGTAGPGSSPNHCFQKFSVIHRSARRKSCPYTGTGLHRVAQIAAEVTGLVLGVVAAGQLGQALGTGENRRVNEAQ